MSASPEQKLQWAEQDYRIAVDNLDAAERRHEAARDAYNDAVLALNDAREAIRASLS
jgi:hypothetical protein